MWRRCSWTLDAKHGVDMLEHHRLMPRWARLIYIANDPGSTFMRRRIASSTDSVRSSVRDHQSTQRAALL